MELVYDPDLNVKLLAIESIFSLIDLFTDEVKQRRITPLFIDLITSENCEIKIKISQLFGQIYYKVKKIIYKIYSF